MNDQGLSLATGDKTLHWIPGAGKGMREAGTKTVGAKQGIGKGTVCAKSTHVRCWSGSGL